MKNYHKELILLAKRAIDEVFGDTSVPASQTLEDLEELTSYISIMIDGIRGDIKREAEIGE